MAEQSHQPVEQHVESVPAEKSEQAEKNEQHVESEQAEKSEQHVESEQAEKSEQNEELKIPDYVATLEDPIHLITYEHKIMLAKLIRVWKLAYIPGDKRTLPAELADQESEWQDWFWDFFGDLQALNDGLKEEANRFNDLLIMRGGDDQVFPWDKGLTDGRHRLKWAVQFSRMAIIFGIKKHFIAQDVYGNEYGTFLSRAWRHALNSATPVIQHQGTRPFTEEEQQRFLRALAG